MDLTAIETYSIQVFDFEILPDFVKIVNIEPKIYPKHGKIYVFFFCGNVSVLEKDIGFDCPSRYFSGLVLSQKFKTYCINI